ncbi:hypothetical protein D3C87_1894860 [compost metagenome]
MGLPIGGYGCFAGADIVFQLRNPLPRRFSRAHLPARRTVRIVPEHFLRYGHIVAHVTGQYIPAVRIRLYR